MSKHRSRTPGVPAKRSSQTMVIGRAAQKSTGAKRRESIGEYGQKIMDAIIEGERIVPSVSRYEFVREIGEGAQGAVFVGNQISEGGIKKEVAFKVLRDTTDEAGIQRLVNEAKLLLKLAHGNIVELLALESMEIVIAHKPKLIGGTPKTHAAKMAAAKNVARKGGAEKPATRKKIYFMVQELIAGASLEKLLSLHTEKKVMMHPAIVGHALNRSAIALDEAHNLTDETGKCLNFVHRSLAPSNVLFSEKAGDIKLSDFGMSLLDAGAISTKLKGKPRYMAPEQFESTSVSASDVWSLGVIAYEAVTGFTPYTVTGKTMSEIREQFRLQLQFPLRAPNEIIQAVAGHYDFKQLSNIIMKCLQRDPHQRLTASELHDLLERTYLYAVGLGPTSRAVAAYQKLIAAVEVGDLSMVFHDDQDESVTKVLQNTLYVDSVCDALRRRNSKAYQSDFLACINREELNPCLKHGENGPYQRQA